MLCLLLLTESSQVQEHWKEYIEEFYEKNGKPTDEDILLEEVGEDGNVPDILGSEFKALQELKNGKAEGTDGKPAELLKALGSSGKEE